MLSRSFTNLLQKNSQMNVKSIRTICQIQMKLIKILTLGAEKAALVAKEVLSRVRSKLGY